MCVFIARRIIPDRERLVWSEDPNTPDAHARTQASTAKPIFTVTCQ